jgi:protease IV
MGLIGRFFAGLWRVLDGTRKVLHLVLLLVIFGVLWAALRQSVPLVPQGAALIVRPQGRLVEQLSGDPVDRAFAEATSRPLPETLVREVTDSIDAAGKDARIQAIVLETGDLTGGGFSKLEAVARSLRAFRARGKKVYAYGEYLTQEQYYLAAQADELWLDPAGLIELEGFGAFRHYYKDLLDKLGVTLNVFKVGSFKSYAEQYTRMDMSSEDREQTEAWLKPLWQAYAQGIEHARKLKEGALAAYVNELVPRLQATHGDAALMAEQGGLVTGRKNRVEFEAHVADAVGEDTVLHGYRAVRDRDYRQLRRTDGFHRRGPAVAVLVAVGEIADGERPPGEIGGESLAGVLREARFDADIAAVVLRIDSPGGSMMASERIRAELDALKAAGKPVVASFSSVAASGGYYIAMDADEIWAESTSITGSIGVFALVPTFERTLGKIGVGADGTATSKIAAGARLERPLGPELKEALQLGVEDAYARFVGHVADGRGKSREEIEALAQGRVWLAPDAASRGLVDHLGSVEEAVAAAAARAHLQPGFVTEWREKHLSLREAILRDLRMEGARIAARLANSGLNRDGFAALYARLAATLAPLARLGDPRGLYAYCACDLR